MINLEKDLNRFKVLKKIYKDKYDVNIVRFNAINGKLININKFNKVSLICKLLCPKSVIGIGLSHFHILQKYKNYDNYDYMLILEDDAIPLFKNLDELKNIVKNMPKDCDILNLRCIGMCFKNNQKYVKSNFTLSGGAVAYIVKKSSIPKINKKILHHIDFMRAFNKSINIYSYNTNYHKLFNLYDHESNNLIKNYDFFGFQKIKLDNINLHEVLTYKIIRIPILNYEFNYYHFFIFIITIIFIIKFKYKLNNS